MGGTVFVLPHAIGCSSKPIIVMKDNQLELTLGNRSLRALRAEVRAERRAFMARMWFQRMHCVVEQAREWVTPRVSRSEQGYLSLTPLPDSDRSGGSRWDYDSNVR